MVAVTWYRIASPDEPTWGLRRVLYAYLVALSEIVYIGKAVRPIIGRSANAGVDQRSPTFGTTSSANVGFGSTPCWSAVLILSPAEGSAPSSWRTSRAS